MCYQAKQRRIKSPDDIDCECVYQSYSEPGKCLWQAAATGKTKLNLSKKFTPPEILSHFLSWDTYVERQTDVPPPSGWTWHAMQIDISVFIIYFIIK